MSGLLFAATLGTTLACGLVAGVFFGFSSFVMPALTRLPPEEGIAAMQAINRAAPTPVFLSALLGTAVACAGLVVTAGVAWGERPAAWLLAGSVLYLAGTLALTIAYHVPLNNALAAVDPHEADAAAQWTRYAADWTAWNHVRSAAALGAAGLLTVALSLG